MTYRRLKVKYFSRVYYIKWDCTVSLKIMHFKNISCFERFIDIFNQLVNPQAGSDNHLPFVLP